MEFVQIPVRLYYDYLDDHADLRVKNWLGMSSPFPTIALSLAYFVIVKFLGPKFMENRKPFQLRKTIIAYNFIQILISWKLFNDAAKYGWFTSAEHAYSWQCQNIDRSPSGMALNMAQVSWLYYISKFIEFFDTFFFVLRKRYDQVSTLHVIHHGIMPVSVWFGVKFYPGGHGTFFGFLNSGVHIVMYTYYMLAAIGPQMQKYLWWKKYLTAMQMVQFVAVFIHSIQLFFYNPCGYPLFYCYVLIGHAVMFFLLFKAFYVKSYASKKHDDGPSNEVHSMLNGMCFSSIKQQVHIENNSL